MRQKSHVRLTHQAPKKKGKLESRTFKTVDEAMEYIKRNTADVVDFPRHSLPGRLRRKP